MTIRRTCKARNNVKIVVGMFKEQPRPKGIFANSGHFFPKMEHFLYRDWFFRYKMEDIIYSLNHTPLDDTSPWRKLISNIEK